MNETLRRILSYVLVFIVGAGIATGTIFYTIIKHGDEQFRQAQGTISQLTEANRQLQSDYQRASDTARQLEERLSDRQRVINNIAETVDGLQSGLGQSSDLIQQIIDTVDQLEHLLHGG